MNLANVRFLVVDDHRDLRQYACLLLGDLGYSQVDTAVDGQDALEKLRISQPVRYDIVLTDLSMPRLDGFGLLRAIKADPALQHLPVIVMSLHDAQTHAPEAIRLGAAAYLTKPVRSDALEAAIRKALPGLGHPSS